LGFHKSYIIYHIYTPNISNLHNQIYTPKFTHPINLLGFWSIPYHSLPPPYLEPFSHLTRVSDYFREANGLIFRLTEASEKWIHETESLHMLIIFKIVILWCKFLLTISSSSPLILIINFYRWLRELSRSTQQRFLH
jgi:hypothetical protein